MPLKISWGNHVPEQDLSPRNGYGYATERIVSCLRSLGYEVNFNDPYADVHIHFDQPQHLVKPRIDMYTILYHPWESTLLKPGWADIMNTADEVWSPSPLITKWYSKYNNVIPPTYTFLHGVDAAWAPHERALSGPLKFLHVGGEANRKGLTEIIRGFREAFTNSEDVELTVKITHNYWQMPWNPRVSKLTDMVDLPELVDIFNDHHVYAYPSWGEGFGLTPLQALATGMPTIIPGAWAPYEDFIDPKLNISSSLWTTPWPKVHPGQMLKPSLDDLIESLRYSYNNYESLHQQHLARVDEIKKTYDWMSLTRSMMEQLEHRLS